MFLAFWVGATDTKQEGKWLWRSDNSLMSNNKTIINSVVSWNVSRPRFRLEENCATWATASNVLIDTYCNNVYRYICYHSSMNKMLMH